ncbi:type IV toxin-antitoxin system AbiEi family antitoxin domain-containing protein [Agromyces italicus]|uniref:type IV toxin-antitoxin system AbiEi family antitoxin domain-containing protein n=1 Tax=Agromyces italicus TaxID=279572 RepID=UPI0003B3AAD1|nr:type IV toxin-antitoxin system AbiEi family antitoxin domain-containing protein [Agromyces italicus]
MHDLERTMRRSGGVARMTTLQEAGHTRHHLRRALDAGRLVRVRRNWVALPGADGDLLAAAGAGVVLSCVTRAKQLGLWVLDEQGLHVATDGHGAVPSLTARVHWSRPVVPRHPDELVDPIENVLALVAGCQPFERAFVVWESALNKRLTTREALVRLPFGPQARRILECAQPYSDSGLESLFLTRLRWLDVRIVPQAWIAERRVDFLIGDRLVVQIDGGHHVGPQRDADNEHDATLALLGFQVIRIGYRQVVEDWPGVQDRIMRALALGLHLRR